MFKNKWSIGNFLIWIAVLLPILFIPLHNGHDWGDDFAQYLLQAKSLTGEASEGLVTHFEEYSPANKGWLFSLLLIPVTLSDSHELLIGKIVITFFIVLLATFLFLNLLSKINTIAAAVLTGFFIYNYHILSLKDQILPDLLFVALLLFIEYVNSSKKNANVVILLAILILLMTGFRSAGMAAFPALVFVLLLHYFFYGGMQKIEVRKSVIALSISFAGLLLFLAFTGSKTEGTGWYLKLIYLKSNPMSILENLNVYRSAFTMFFEQEVPAFVNTISQIIIVPAMVLGFAFRLITKINFTEVFVVFYCGLILIYPYHHEPIRFLLPVLAIGMIYLAEFYTTLFSKLKIEFRNIAMVCLCLLLLVTNIKNTVSAFTKPPFYAPFTSPSKELFNFIQTNISPSHPIAFFKPWALSYFTSHASVPLKEYENANYIIVSKNDYLFHFGPPPGSYEMVFVNEEYKVLKR